MREREMFLMFGNARDIMEYLVSLTISTLQPFVYISFLFL